MFTFIHLSSEQKHDEWNIFLFLCTFFLFSLQSASSPPAWHIGLRVKGENWDVRTRKYSLSIIFCESKMLQMRNDKSEAPRKLSRYKETLFTRYNESFSRGKEISYWNWSLPLLWGKNVLRFWVRINFFWCLSTKTFLFWRSFSLFKIFQAVTLINRVVTMNE